MAMAHIAPFSREAEDESAAFAAQSARLEREFGAQVTVVLNPQVVELSSTEVRAALAQGGERTCCRRRCGAISGGSTCTVPIRT